ncbi:MAG: hypothetical protein QG616_1693 [Pseudomonadota bacterium]|nr:hypothetical protein [Betaproteobacteria bacterium]MDQ5881861.1 hypothetical protein [Pseudomonadota bacterium]
MAGTTTHPEAFRNTVADLVDSTLSTTAKLVFRLSGSAASPGTAVATLSMANPAFGAASGGVITADTITSDTNAAGNASPVATATLQTGAGTVIVHTTVAASGDAINLSGGLTIGAGDTVACSSLTYAAMP